MMKKNSWYNIKQTISLYLLILLIFTIFRIIFFVSGINKLADYHETTTFLYILKAFGMGIRFDLVIIGYLMLIPYLIISIATIINKPWKLLFKMVFYFVLISFSFAFFIAAADIPYFNQFFSHLTIGAFYSMDTPVFVAKLIFEEPRIWLYIFPFLFIIFIFYRLLKKIFKYPGITNRNNSRPSFYFILKYSLVTLLFLGFMMVGIRGRLASKSPIRVGTAYFCNNPFLNQMGLNPVFTLTRSYINSKDIKEARCDLMDGETAVKNVQEFLKIENHDPKYPIARHIIPDTISNKKHNVVIVIMEGMSYAKMGRYGNTKNLTPFLDSISYESYFFENIYTSGIHTYNGIFSTLFSYPTIFRQHPMKGVEMLRYNGIAHELSKHGYSTSYFCTHDGQFDNVEGFLKANDFQTIIEETDYPRDKILSVLGVPDDYLFKYSLPVLTESYNDKKPFLAAYMTASNHGPYVVPEYFKPKNKDIKDQIVEYADWSIRKFIELASLEPWFDNTIFVFVADHGGSYDITYDMPMNYFHTPLIIYAPKILKQKKTFECLGGQIDIFPTVMGLLQLAYTNNTLGIDLLMEQRPYIYYAADYEYGVVSDEYYLIEKLDVSTGLYKYKLKDRKNYAVDKPEIVNDMKKYAESNIQAFQFISNNRMQFYEP